MKLLILDGVPVYPPGRNLSYRGTYRITPSYSNSHPADHERNQLFMWYLEEGGQAGVVHDITKAHRLAKLCNDQDPNCQFEVVEIVGEQNTPQANGILIGFDLVEGSCNSLLQFGLKIFSGALKLPHSVRVLEELVNMHFSPRLNSNGLFQTAEAALLCLQCMVALQSFSSDLYEGGDLGRFKILALYRVTSGASTVPN